MKFRLTYEGELRATQRDPEGTQRNPLAVHKHDIRRVFHSQLKQLWNTNAFLREKRVARGRSYRPIHDENTYWGGPESEDPYTKNTGIGFCRWSARNGVSIAL
jgi:hypothetical protein